MRRRDGSERATRRKGQAGGVDGLLPGYHDLVEIGGGAFSTVYRANEEETGRQVALKVLKLEVLHGPVLETFNREIQALGKVSDHPNIVTLYRPLVTTDGRPALVLELCRASMAEQVRTHGPMDPASVVRAGIKIAGALETAHRHGFLHRDMKPQNVLVTQFGEPALADFGVAAVQVSAQTASGVFGFTTLHTAPEMLEGQPLTAATDLYGLASSMFQLLTGSAPFAAFDNEAPASVILRILRDPVPPLRAEAIPIGLSDLIEATMAKAPADRPATAVEFAETLRSVEASQGWQETEYVIWGDGDRPAPIVRVAAQAPVLPAEMRLTRVESPATDPVPVPREIPTTRQVVEATEVEPGPSDWVPPPPPPAPMVVRRGPSVASPALASRNVINPDDSMRGHRQPPIEPPLTPLAPLAKRSELSENRDRPIFVDPERPDESGWVAAATTGNVYEQTMQVGKLFAAARPTDQPSMSLGQRYLLGLPPAALLSIGAGAIVVIAALLVVLGVL